MGLFSVKKTNSVFPWVNLTSEVDVNERIQDSKNTPVLFFKHSTRCGTSLMALKSFENNWTADKENVKFVLVDVLREREWSNHIASELNVRHQSPQAILVINGEVVYHASHSEISVRRIENLV